MNGTPLRTGLSLLSRRRRPSPDRLPVKKPAASLEGKAAVVNEHGGKRTSSTPGMETGMPSHHNSARGP